MNPSWFSKKFLWFSGEKDNKANRLPFYYTLTFRIMAGILIFGLIGGVAFQIYEYFEQKEHLQEMAKKGMADSLKTASKRIEYRLYQNYQNQLVQLSASSALRSYLMEPKDELRRLAARQELEDVLFSRASFFILELRNLKAEILVSAEKCEYVPDYNIKEFLKEYPVISSIHEGCEGELHVDIFSPVFDRRGQRIVGWVKGDLNVRMLSDIMSDAVKEHSSEKIFLSSPQGEVLLTHPSLLAQNTEARGFYQKVFASPEVLGKDFFQKKYQDLYNHEVLMAARKIKVLNWFLVIEKDTQEVMVPLKAVQRTMTLELIIIIIPLLVAAYFIGRRLGGPLAQMTQAAEQIGRGNLDHPIPRFYKSEMELLGSSLEIMRGDLKRNLEALQQWVKERDSLLNLSQKVLNIWDSEALSQEVVQYAQEITRADGAAFFLLESGQSILSLKAATVPVPPRCQRMDLREQKAKPYLCTYLPMAGEIIFCPSIRDDPRFDFPEECMAVGYQAGLSLPLILEGKPKGSLLLFFKGPREFQESELNLLNILTRIVSLALEKNHHYYETKSVYEKLEMAQETMVKAEKLKTIGQLTSGIAHDFNNLLATVIIKADILERQAILPEVIEGLRSIREAAAHGAEIVRRLLTFARPQRAEELQPLDLNLLVQEGLEITRPRWKDQAQAAGAQITIALSLGEITPALGSVHQIKEVLINLVINAVDAMPQGGTLGLKTYMKPCGICVEVADTGTGIPEEIKDKIFEPFFSTKGDRGTGLGLAMCQAIMEQHGGKISVSSEGGKGTTFELCFPPSAQPLTKEAEPQAPLPVKTGRFLLVDDNKDFVSSLGNLLQSVGHEVSVHFSGPSALQAFAQDPFSFDLVLTDHGMPEMSGFEVTKSIKAQNPRIPVILMTGLGEHVDKQGKEEAGVDLVLAKPFKFQKLLEVLREFLSPDRPTAIPNKNLSENN